MIINKWYVMHETNLELIPDMIKRVNINGNAPLTFYNISITTVTIVITNNAYLNT